MAKTTNDQIAKKDKDDPSTTSVAYDEMKPRWEIMRNLLGGTERMRDAGEEMLPKHEEESDASWKRRLAGATLLNMTEITLDMLAGKPFSDPLTLPEDADSRFTEWEPDIDLQGNSLDVFSRRAFRTGMAKGLVHFLVDFPRSRDEDGRTRTIADDRAENIRPYCVLVEPEALLFASGTLVDGREVLTHVRISENEIVRDGFAEKLVERIRVLEPGRVMIYERQTTANSQRSNWNLVDDYETGLDFIPLVTFYTNREGLGLSKPPLLDLAYMNVQHWQLDADLNNIVSVANFPVLAMTGVDSEAGMVRLGPNQVLALANENAKIQYVEHTGAAIKTGSDRLAGIEDKMAAYGAQFLKKKPGDLKATVRALDSAEALSQLQAITLNFKDSLEQVMRFMGEWINAADAAPSVEVNSDFGLSDPDNESWMAIESARKRREISRKAYLEEMQRRGWLSDDYSLEDDLAQIEEELENDLTGAATLDLDPGAGEVEDPEGEGSEENDA